MIIRKLTIILVALNFASAFLVAGGVAAQFDENPQVGADQKVEEINNESSSVGSGVSSLGDDIGGGVITAVGKLASVDDLIFAFPTMLGNLGVPTFIVVFATGPLYVAALFDFISIIGGFKFS